MRDRGLDTLLDLNGEIFAQGVNYYAKFEVLRTETTPHRPHGIRYCLTLHDKYGNRILGFDNAHAVRQPRRGHRGRIVEYDHVHNPGIKRLVPYVFTTPDQLISDFWDAVNNYLGEIT